MWRFGYLGHEGTHLPTNILGESHQDVLTVEWLHRNPGSKIDEPELRVVSDEISRLIAASRDKYANLERVKRARKVKSEEQIKCEPVEHQKPLAQDIKSETDVKNPIAKNDKPPTEFRLIQSIATNFPRLPRFRTGFI